MNVKNCKRCGKVYNNVANIALVEPTRASTSSRMRYLDK